MTLIGRLWRRSATRVARLASVPVLLTLCVCAHAALTDLGNGLINAPAANLTRVADGNRFQTMSNSTPNLVANVIAAGPSQFHVGTVTYTLSAADFSTTTGAMTGFGAVAFVNYLNVTNYKGYADWRLQNLGTVQNFGACGGNCYYDGTTPITSSQEWWELFYNELGGVTRVPLATTHNANYALFSNIQASYWAEYTGNDQAVVFTDDGGQGCCNYTTNLLYAWVVRTGLSSATPPPMSHLVLSPAALAFGNQVVGSTSTAQTVTVKNTGTGPATITGVAPSGDFSIANNTCPAALPVGSSCTVAVTFAPTVVDARAGTLTITADGTGYSTTLNGTGTLSVSLTPATSSVAFGTAVTLTWQAATTTATCRATSGGAAGDGWTGTLASSGSKAVTEPDTGSYTYALACTDGSQTATAQAVVNVEPPTVTLTTNATNLTVGQHATLTWTSTYATTCTATGTGAAGDGWSGSLATAGTATVSESSSGLYTYTIACASGSQSATAAVQVFYNAKPSSGGGGAWNGAGLADLLALGLLRAARRRRPGL